MITLLQNPPKRARSWFVVYGPMTLNGLVNYGYTTSVVRAIKFADATKALASVYMVTPTMTPKKIYESE